MWKRDRAHACFEDGLGSCVLTIDWKIDAAKRHCEKDNAPREGKGFGYSKLKCGMSCPAGNCETASVANYHGDADAKVRAQNAGLDSIGEGVALLSLDVLVPGVQQAVRK